MIGFASAQLAYELAPTRKYAQRRIGKGRIAQCVSFRAASPAMTLEKWSGAVSFLTFNGSSKFAHLFLIELRHWAILRRRVSVGG